MTKLYDMPFEKRIRIKYMMFGLMCGLTVISGSFAVGGGIVLTLMQTIPQLDWEKTPRLIAVEIFTYGILTIMLSILLYYMWHDRNTPKKYPDKEPFGLKHDWDKVSDT